MNAKERILTNILIDPFTQCWVWQGFIGKSGYARLFIEKGKGKRKFVHRYSYENFVGKIPDDLTLDHICRNRKCCNPTHLQPVTIKQNTLLGIGFAPKNKAKSHCRNGHEYSESNTYHVRNERACKICLSINSAKYREKKNKGIKTGHLTVIERINKNIKPNGNGCMVWNGTIHPDGYGRMVINKKQEFVHRALYRELIGEIPDGYGVYRSCGNLLCCSAEHLCLLPWGTSPTISKIKLVKSGGI